MATSWLRGATDGSRRVLAIAALRNPVRSDHGAGVHRSIRRAGTQACSFAGRTVLTVVHESTRVPSFRGYHAPRNSPNIVPTPA